MRRPIYTIQNGKIQSFSDEGQADAFVNQENERERMTPPAPGNPAMPIPDAAAPATDPGAEVRMRKGEDFQVFPAENQSRAEAAGFVMTTDADITAEKERREATNPMGDGFFAERAMEIYTAGEGAARGALSIPAFLASQALDVDITGGDVLAGLYSLDPQRDVSVEDAKRGIQHRAKKYHYSGIAGQIGAFAFGGAGAAKMATGARGAALAGRGGSKLQGLARASEATAMTRGVTKVAGLAAEGAAASGLMYNEDRWIEDREFSADEMWSSMAMGGILAPAPGLAFAGAKKVAGKMGSYMGGAASKAKAAAKGVAKKAKPRAQQLEDLVNSTEEQIARDELELLGHNAGDYIGKRTGGSSKSKVTESIEDLRQMHVDKLDNGTPTLITPEGLGNQLKKAALDGNMRKTQGENILTAVQQNRVHMRDIASEGAATRGQLRKKFSEIIEREDILTPLSSDAVKMGRTIKHRLWRLSPEEIAAKKAGKVLKTKESDKLLVSGEDLWKDRETLIKQLSGLEDSKKAAGAKLVEGYEEVALSMLSPESAANFQAAMTRSRTLRRFAGPAHRARWGEDGVSPMFDFVSGIAMKPINPLAAGSRLLRAKQKFTGSFGAMIRREAVSKQLIDRQELSRAGIVSAVTSALKKEIGKGLSKGPKTFSVRKLPFVKMFGGAIDSQTVQHMFPASVGSFSAGFGSDTEAYQTRVQEIAEAGNNLDGATTRINGEMGDMADLAPMLTMDVTARYASTMMHLNSKIPRGVHAGGSPLMPEAKTHKPSPGEITKFVRHYEAATDPWSVIDDVGNGKATKEGIETLSVVFPEFYKELQGRTMELLGGRTKPLPRAQAAQVERVLRMPGALIHANKADFQRRYTMIQAQLTMQQQAAEGGAGGAPSSGSNGKPGTNKGAPTLSQQMRTGSSRATENIYN